MIRLLSAELLKLRRSKMFIVSALGISASPFMNFLLFIAIKNQLPENTATLHDYFRQTNGFIALLLGTLLFGLMATYIFNREYQEKTLKNLLVIPIDRTQLILCKIIILFVWIILLMTLAFIISALLGMTGLFVEVNYQVFIQHFKSYLLCGILLFALTPTVILITMVFKNYVYPTIYTIVVTFIGLILINSKYSMIYPWSIPFIIVDQEEVIMYPIIYSWISLGLIFIISLSVAIIYFNKADIQ